MKIVASTSDKVECIFFKDFTHKVKNTEDRLISKGHSTLKLKSKIVHSTSATIFRNGNLCIRMIHSRDAKPQNYTILDFLDAESKALNDPDFELFKTSLFGCPKLPGVNTPIGIAHMQTKSGISVVGTIHKWYPQSLSDYIDDQIEASIFNAPESIRILHSISEILYSISEAGYIHTDIKAANILLDENLNPVISDIDSFLPRGVRGDCTGTADHMAPEMINCDYIDSETDTYSMAQLMYDLLIDRPEGLFSYDFIKNSGYDIHDTMRHIDTALDSLLYIIKNRPSGRDEDERHFGASAKYIYKIITHRPHDLRPITALLMDEIDNIYRKE